MKKGVKMIGGGCLVLVLVFFVWFAIAFKLFSGGHTTGYQIGNSKISYQYFNTSSYMIQTTDMPSADSKTFELIPNIHSRGQEYAKDKDQVFFMGKVVAGADPATFELTGWVMGKDSKAVFRGADMISNDSKNFKVEGNISRDSKYVYNRMDTIHGADPKTYKEIKGRRNLGIDKDHVYCQNEKVEGSDPRSFRLVGLFYWKDRTGVYDNYCKKLSMDHRTLFTMKKGTNYLRDKDHIYHGKLIIKDADRSSFRILNNSFSKDKNHVFYYEHVIEDADISSFKPIDAMYAKDKNNIFYTYKKVEDVDVSSFEAIKISDNAGGIKHKDKDGYFVKGKRKEGDK